ncbi:MAG TPA: hypothetical protein VLC71_11890 [Thermomonas sp.]|nr:hypothetical protein [Thermomonas sp.]
MCRLSRLILIAALVATPAWAQDSKAPKQTAEEAAAIAEMHALEAEIGTGKRAFVEEQLVLSKEQAAKFWPIYDAHQSALLAFNKRRIDNIMRYARAYKADSVDDAAALSIVQEALKLEKDEAAQLERTFHKLKRAIPAVQAARYLQLENKLRAMVRFEQAAQVPVAR